jgi:hypothetical protein
VNKQEKLMYFMGQLHSQIIMLVDRAAKRSDDVLHQDLVDLEQFFNETKAELFATKDVLQQEIQVGVGVTIRS